MTAMLTTAIRVEGRKFVASPVTVTTTILLVVGIGVLASSLTFGAMAGNQQVVAQLGPAALMRGWPMLTSVVAQITAAGGLLGFGVGLSWSVGREFTDGTINSLFGFPVSRGTIILAKLVVHILWSLAVAVLLTVLLAVAGMGLGLGSVDGEVAGALGRQFLLTVLTAQLAVPAAWAATLGRGPLAGIAATIGAIVLGQVTAIMGVGVWFPFAVPALWILDSSSVHNGQLSLVVLVPAAFGTLTLWAWSRLQLDR